jgi:hypothetical protein
MDGLARILRKRPVAGCVARGVAESFSTVAQSRQQAQDARCAADVRNTLNSLIDSAAGQFENPEEIVGLLDRA